MAKQRVKRRIVPRRREIFNTVVRASFNLLQNPFFLTAIVLGYYSFANQDKLKTFIKKFENNAILGSLAKELKSRLPQTAGGITTGLASLSVGNPASTLVAALIIFLLTVFIIPAQTVFWDYAFLAFFLSAIWRSRTPRLQLLFGVLAAITFSLELWGKTLFG